MRDETLNVAFRAMCDKLHIHGTEIFGKCLDNLQRLRKAQEGGTTEDKKILSEIAELKEKKHRLSKLLTKHFIEPEQYSEQVFEIDGQIRALTRGMDKAPAKKDELRMRIEELAEIFKRYDGSVRSQTEILDTVVEKIIICDDGTIRFKMLAGLEFTERLSGYNGE